MVRRQAAARRNASFCRCKTFFSFIGFLLRFDVLKWKKQADRKREECHSCCNRKEDRTSLRFAIWEKS